MRNLSYENEFDFQENETACRTHFYVTCFVLRLILKQVQENSETALVTVPFILAKIKLNNAKRFERIF